MRKWISCIIQLNTQTATSKAYGEVSDIAEKMGYEAINVFAHSFNGASDRDLFTRIDGMTGKVRRGDLIVYQYPSFCGWWFDLCFLRDLRYRGAKVVLFVQDVDKLRWPQEHDELVVLNEADLILTLSEAMTEKLVSIGVTTPMIHKEMWDYKVIEDDAPLSPVLKRELVFAGNIIKSGFLRDWPCQTKLSAFGMEADFELSPAITYQGSFYQSELVRRMPKDCFGIAWDNNLEDGAFYRDYTRYNSPFKVSFYLSLGLPVIVWSESSIASVIKKYKIGFAVDSLEEIDSLLASLTDEDLSALKERVNKFSRLLRDGFFTRKALLDIEEKVLFEELDNYKDAHHE